MSAEHFYGTIDNWLKELDNYSFEQLMIKPADDSWSLGQVYIHLIEATDYFLKQVETCLKTNENENENCLPAARQMFINDALPDMRLNGPPSNAKTAQPASKEQLQKGLLNLKEEIKRIESIKHNNTFKGKTKHFGLQYFNADEWLQFAEMHFRHHERQRQRIEGFLKEQNFV